MSNQSEEIKDLIAALAKAQGSMKAAVFNKGNLHFKSRYADFSSCMDACREPLSSNGLAVIQSTKTTPEGKLVLVTMLAHTSGQWMISEFPIIAKTMDSQGIGSALTYSKRYSLSAMIGIVADEDKDDDDDGEVAVGRGRKEEFRQPLRPPQKINAEQAHMINTLESKLDQESKDKLRKYLSGIGVEKIEDIQVQNFQSILRSYSNAVQLIEQKEVVNA